MVEVNWEEGSENDGSELGGLNMMEAEWDHLS